MDFYNLAQKRYSVRTYHNAKVEQEKLEKILQAGRIAPTAANKQPNHFLVLDTPESLAKLSKGANIHKAPLAIIVCANINAAWVRPFDKKSMLDIDASIATDHMMLCAEDLGLSSCWITYFNPSVVREEFNMPKHFEPINILVVGYSADEVAQSAERHSKTRKALNEMLSYNSF